MPELTLVPAGSLVPSPTNPRKAFERTALEELAGSLRAQGVLQPLVVRPIPYGKVPGGRELDLFDEFYEIVAGERRYRASQIAGVDPLPCIVVDMTDAQVVEAQIVENAQRSDVSPVEEADAYGQLMEFPEYRDSGDAVAMVASKIHRSKSQVYARLKLRSLGPEGRELLANGAMSASVALDVARLQPKDQARACKALYSAGGEVTLKNARDWIRGNLLLRVADFPFDTDDPSLLPSAGACSACPKNTAVDKAAFVGEAGGRKGMCMDPGCFRAKLAVTEARALEGLRRDHPGEILLVNANWQRMNRAGVLERDDYSETSEGVPGARLALAVGAFYPEHRFRPLWVTLRGKTTADRKDEEARRRKDAQTARSFRSDLADACVGAFAHEADDDLLRRALAAAWRRLSRESQEVLATAMGWEPVVAEGSLYRDFGKIGDAHVAALASYRLPEFLLRLSVHEDLIVSEHDTAGHHVVPHRLGELAQRLDIDALQMMEDAEERANPRRLVNLLGGGA